MNFVTIVTGIFALAKAVPIVAGYIEKFYVLWTDKQIEELDDKYKLAYKKRKVLLTSIKKATTDDERKTLSIILSSIND